MRGKIAIFALCAAMIAGTAGVKSAEVSPTEVNPAGVSPAAIAETVDALRNGSAQDAMMEKGVRQVAALWLPEDGNDREFSDFCRKNYISDAQQREAVFLRICGYLESIYGFANEMSIDLKWNTMVDTGPVYPVDERFAAYNPLGNMAAEMFSSKTAFYVGLNFPELSLAEKNALGDDPLEWGYARLGDVFANRRPSEGTGEAGGGSDNIYVAQYNIYAGKLRDAKGRNPFPAGMILLSHWNLRDEIKSNYGGGEAGLAKQRMLYAVMERIISQEIPAEVINSGEFGWDPVKNTLWKGGRKVAHTPEGGERYRQILNTFRVEKAKDEGDTKNFMGRTFDRQMEIDEQTVEGVLRGFVSAPELREVGRLISSRLGRRLEGFDIWYDGFKARSNMDEQAVSAVIRGIYPDAKAFEAAIPGILEKLGFGAERARSIGDKISVDQARGSGHAWGAERAGSKSHLRTRVPAGGLDYKGYNIAMHELGHNVEQTLSLYDVEYYTMHGVPNTAFTEALAFVFQKRDLEALGVPDNDPHRRDMEVLDRAWSLYEICGMSLLEISMWRWMYANPDATPQQLGRQVELMAKEIWNEYYYPVIGVRDQTVLAIYSHIINYPLYLSSYAFGNIIEFQLENHLRGKDFAGEVERIFTLGKLTPTRWMSRATGSTLDAEPMLEELRGVLERHGVE